MLVFGFFAVGGINIKADAAIPRSTYDANLMSLYNQYPNGCQWTGSFDGGSQCYGWARLVAYNVFGSHVKDWPTTNDVNSVKIGDVIQFGWNAHEGKSHTIFVTDITGDTIWYTDCNYDYNCGIRWEATMSRSGLSHSFDYDLHLIYSSPGVITNNNPVGNVDSISGGLNTIYVTGWAFDPDESSKNISIHVYIGGNSATGEGHNIGVANLERNDVNNAYGIAGNHGFAASIITSKTGTQPIYIYAIDSQGGNNPCIGSGTVTIKSSNPASVEEGLYFIESKIAPGKVLDVVGGSSADKTNVQLFSLDNSSKQIFKIVDEGDGYYSIRTSCSNYNSGLDVAGISSAAQANIAQYEYIGQKNQKWKFYPSGDGYYYIMSGCGNFMDVSKGETSDGTNISTWRYEESDNLKFKLLKKCNIAYFPMGGVLSDDWPDVQYKVQGYEIKIWEGVPQRSGYRFLGWSTSRTDSTVSYQPGDSIIITDNLILYAVWELNQGPQQTYTLTFDANGGSITIANQTGNGNITISNSEPTRSGYTFKSWNTKTDGTGTNYAPGAIYNLSADVTLYAIWQKGGTSDNSNQQDNTEVNPTASTKIKVKSDSVYKNSKVTVTAKAEGVPKGYYLAVFDGKIEVKRGTNTEVTYEIKDLVSKEKKLTVKVIDKDGNVQKNAKGEDLTETIEINVKPGFINAIIAFFRKLFRANKVHISA